MMSPKRQVVLELQGCELAHLDRENLSCPLLSLWYPASREQLSECCVAVAFNVANSETSQAALATLLPINIDRYIFRFVK